MRGWLQLSRENHLFLSCPLLGQLWHMVRNWLCFTLRIIIILLTIFIGLLLFLVALNLGAPSCIWFCLTWKERNDMIFCGKENYLVQLLKKSKVTFFLVV